MESPAQENRRGNVRVIHAAALIFGNISNINHKGELMNRYFQRFCVATILVGLFVEAASAAVIFSELFDNSADWQSQQTVAKAVGGVDRAWPATFVNACTATCPPERWTAYRTSASYFSDTPGSDTYHLNAAGARGATGKGITMNVESSSGYGDWAGGSLDLSLGLAGYQELYVRYWLKYDANWVWTDPANTQHSQQKLIRISRFNGDINDHVNNNPQMYFTPTSNGPSWMPDWYYNKSFSLTSFFSSEFFNPQPNGSIGYGPTQTFTSLLWPSDGQWHSYEFRVKMNSAPGVADGEWEIWIDGQNSADAHAVKRNVLWVDATGSVTQGWNYLMFLDNITVAPAPVLSKKEMQIYMDDIVVSTHYSGPPPVPAGVTATGTSDTSIKLNWSAGINGANYLLDGYHISYGKDANNLTSRVDLGNLTEYEITSLDTATRYYFAVSASNKDTYETNRNESTRALASAVTVDTVAPLLTLLPVTTPTRTASQLVSGGVSDPGGIASVTVKVGAAAAVAASVSGNGWSYGIPSLTEGGNAIVVTARDVSGNESVVTGSILLDTSPPALTVLPVATPTLFTSQTISGDVSDLVGVASVFVQVDGGEKRQAVVNGSAWSYRLENLKSGSATQVSITAMDTAGNESGQAAAAVSIGVLQAGDLDGDVAVGVEDAQFAMQMAVGSKQPDAGQLQRGDLAPMPGGVPAPDGVIDTGDAVVILGIVTGLTKF